MSLLRVNIWFRFVLGLLILSLAPSVEVLSQPAKAGENIAEIRWSNDFFNQTDRYFSNGIDLAVTHDFMSKSPTRFILIPTSKANKVYHGLTLSHHLFTPDQLFTNEIQFSERPYASYALLGHKKTAFYSQRRFRLESEFQLGILGKYSGGESVQNGIHNLLPASQTPDGWENQLGTDLAVNYRIRGEKGIVSTEKFVLAPHGDLRLGIPYTDAGAGLYLQFGKFPDYFNNLAMFSDQGISYFLFADVSGRYVHYNATLEGGLISGSPHTLPDNNSWVSEFQFGAGFSYRNLSIKYTQHYLSQEYETGLKHKWGDLSIQFKF